MNGCRGELRHLREWMLCTDKHEGLWQHWRVFFCWQLMARGGLHNDKAL